MGNGSGSTNLAGLRDLGTREGFLGAIRDCGQYIIDHAESLLGEYPGTSLSEISLTATFGFDGAPRVTLTREHIALPCFDEGCVL